MSNTPKYKRSWWKSFWEDLNIRKFIVVVLFGCLVYSLLCQESIDPVIKDLTLMAISYYFGYSNSHTTDGEKKRIT